MIRLRSWQSVEVPEDCEKAKVTPIFKQSKKKEPGNHRPVKLALVPGKMMEQILLEAIYKHMKDKKVTVGSTDLQSRNHS